MKIYKIHMSMVLVLGRLKKFQLGNFGYKNPIIFQTAADPDDACFKTMLNLTDILMNQYGKDLSKATEFAQDIIKDVRISKVGLASNDKLK